jgi:ubiquinone/menaquinone biosynthesis C-methylase UbiE
LRTLICTRIVLFPFVAKQFPGDGNPRLGNSFSAGVNGCIIGGPAEQYSPENSHRSKFYSSAAALRSTAGIVGVAMGKGLAGLDMAAGGTKIGRHLVHDPGLSRAEKLYIAVMGVPRLNLRFRAWRVLPLLDGSHKAVLDAGCGPGAFVYEVAERFPNTQVVGIDIDEERLARNRVIAEKCGLTNCRFEVLNVTDASNLIEDKFDLVLTLDNLEHIEDDDLAVQKLFNVLVPGGDLIVHVPGFRRRTVWFGWRVNFDVLGHFRPGYTKEQITGKLTKAGFNVTESYYTYSWIETVTSSISYYVTKAEMKNKYFYALIFPALLALSWLGKNIRPAEGAGVLIRAEKPKSSKGGDA